MSLGAQASLRAYFIRLWVTPIHAHEACNLLFVNNLIYLILQDISGYFVLGCFIDAGAMIMLTVPIFSPLVENMGFDLIWFGIFVVKVQEIGMITPPIGINVYVISGVANDVPMQTIFKGIIPFAIVDLILLCSILLFPSYIMFLPNIFG